MADDDDKLRKAFVALCDLRLDENLKAAFPRGDGTLDAMLDVARETAVMISIELRAPPIADTVYQMFERAIKTVELNRPTKHSKRRHTQK